MKCKHFLIISLQVDLANSPRDIPISPAWYFNQSLLNFNQHLASDADHIFFARSVHEQYHLHSSIYFAMHSIKPDTLTVGTF